MSSTHVGRPSETARQWHALGTYAFLATAQSLDTDAAVLIARAVLAEVDRTCSRFRADSDLSRVNAAPGTWVRVDPLLATATSVALEAAETTAGLVDPCLGRPLIALGYDVDMAMVRARDPRSFPVPVDVRHDPDAWREVRVDPEGAVQIPAGCALDLGATAKAWASDLVAAAVTDQLGCRVIVSLGGDLRIDGPPGDPWPVRVTERPGDSEGEVVLLADGGLATSSTRARRWHIGESPQHHVIDPRTARPVAETWRTVTATGRTCVAANVATTAALVLGPAAGGWLRAHDVTGRLVAHDGTTSRTGAWPTSPASTPDAERLT